MLTDCHMHVWAAARKRIAETGAPREVHAWIVDTLAEVKLRRPQRISYRPHQRGEFFIVETGQSIWTAPAVVFTDAAYLPRCRALTGSGFHEAGQLPTSEGWPASPVFFPQAAAPCADTATRRWPSNP